MPPWGRNRRARRGPAARENPSQKTPFHIPGQRGKNRKQTSELAPARLLQSCEVYLFVCPSPQSSRGPAWRPMAQPVVVSTESKGPDLPPPGGRPETNPENMPQSSRTIGLDRGRDRWDPDRPTESPRPADNGAPKVLLRGPFASLTSESRKRVPPHPWVPFPT